MGRTSEAKRKLIDSACELIHSRSYADVSVNELCQHAGVRKGSFYHFSPSKQDLTLAALDVLAKQLEQRQIGLALPQDLPFAEKVQYLVELLYQSHRSISEATGRVWGCPFGNPAAELSTQDEVIRLKVQHIFESFMSSLEQSLTYAIGRGELPQMDTQLAAQSILAYLEGTLLLSKTWNDPDIILRLARLIPQLITPVPALPSSVQ